jgi:hypothetical protein
LSRLARIYGTDKINYHNYIEHYQRHFAPLRKKKLKVLEIGVGGYDKPDAGGESLRMWKSYFQNSMIFGIDVYDKSNCDESRIKTFRGSQADPEFLRWIIDQIGVPDIIIDDGSHMNKHVLVSFENLFPALADNGIYVIEDLQTSYWHNFGGTSSDLNSKNTTMGNLKKLVDGLNYQDYVRPNYEPNYFDLHIVGMHFYHNMCFIQKGHNNEAPGIWERPSLKNQFLAQVMNGKVPSEAD